MELHVARVPQFTREVDASALCENRRRAMKLLRCSYLVCLTLAVLVFSGATAATTLGRLRGAAVLGHPLALTVPLQTADENDANGLCVAADVYFGDSPIESSNVTARVEGGGAATYIRISVRKPVDEPVVTVYAKVGCQQQSTRKYVLLSEFPSEVQTPQVPTTGGETALAKGSGPTNSVGVASTAAVNHQLPTQSSEKRSTKTKSAVNPVTSAIAEGTEPIRRLKKDVSADSQSSTYRAKKHSGTESGGARLKLLPLDITQNWEPILRWTDELPIPSSDVDVQKRQQAAEMWHAINLTPEAVLQEAGKRAALEAELNTLIVSTRANQAAITELSAQLEVAHARRLWNPAVYSMMLLLSACGVGLVLMVRRGKGILAGKKPWWFGSEDGANEGSLVSIDLHNREDLSVRRSSESTHAVGSMPYVRDAGTPHIDIDIPLPNPVPTVGSAQVGDVDSRAGLQNIESRPMDFLHSNIGALRAINTHEMVDVRQQAEFFLALGQHDEAVGVLYGALSQGTESNPHIYLDLIALLHKLSRKDEYEKVRQAFNALYTCHVPVYGAYSSSSSLGLLDYPDLLQPLIKLWPTSVATEYVEKCLVRDDRDSLDGGIEIDAFKDLLLLHGILQSVSTAASSVAMAVPHRVLPCLRSEGSSVTTHASPTAFVAADVDLDLS